MHFTAVVEIKKVTQYESTGRGDDKSFVHKIVIRSETIEELKKKLIGHIQLL